MTYANRAAEPLLVVAAAQRFWRHCGPLVASPRRALLRDPASAALGELEAIADAEQRAKVVPLQVKLYEAVLAILSDGKEWAAGGKLLDRAFASLPAASLFSNNVSFSFSKHESLQLPHEITTTTTTINKEEVDKKKEDEIDYSVNVEQEAIIFL